MIMSSKIALTVHPRDLSAHLLFEGFAVHTLDLNLQFKKNNAIFLFSFYLTLCSPPVATTFPTTAHHKVAYNTSQSQWILQRTEHWFLTQLEVTGEKAEEK